MENPKYDIDVQLIGTDGNAFAIIGTVRKALRSAGASEADLAAFSQDAYSGDYDNVLATAMRWVNVT